MSARPGSHLPADDRPRIGLALGGGALRGAAHIGVLRVLEQEGIPIDLIAGTSAGALAGLLYASGIPPCEMEAIANRLQFKHIFRWTLPRRTLWDIGPMAYTLEQHVGKEMVSLRLCQSDLEHADIVIRADMGMHRHHVRNIPAFIEAGEAAAREAVPRIRTLLAQWRGRAAHPTGSEAPVMASAYCTAEVTGG